MKRKIYYLPIIGLLLIGAMSFVLAGNGDKGKQTVLRQPDGIDLTVMEPFQQAVTVTLAAGESGKNVGIDVPVGKLFVVEQVSASGSAPSDQRIDLLLMSHISPDLANRSHYLQADRQISGGIAYYKTSQIVKIYADTPSLIARVARSTSPDSVTFRFTVSGYFINK